MPVSLSIKVDVPGFLDYMTEVQEKQVPFATAKGLNLVATDFQLVQRQHMAEIFTIRRQQWVDRSVKIEHFATKAEPWATIAISPPGGGKADILSKFEDDTEKTARGSHGVAIPFDVRRTKSDIIQNAQRPKALHLHAEGGRVVGDKGTFIVKLNDGRELLLQRKDLGKRAAGKAGRGTQERATLLYIFEQHVRINPNLHFLPNADRVVGERWDARFTEAWRLAVESAR